MDACSPLLLEGIATLGWLPLPPPRSPCLLPSSQTSNKQHCIGVRVRSRSRGGLTPSRGLSACEFPGDLYRGAFLGKGRLEIRSGDQEGSQASDTFKQAKRGGLCPPGQLELCRAVINPAAHWMCLFTAQRLLKEGFLKKEVPTQMVFE